MLKDLSEPGLKASLLMSLLLKSHHTLILTRPGLSCRGSSMETGGKLQPLSPQLGWDLTGRMGLVDGRRGWGILDVPARSCVLSPFSKRKTSSCLLHADLFELGSWL